MLLTICAQRILCSRALKNAHFYADISSEPPEVFKCARALSVHVRKMGFQILMWVCEYVSAPGYNWRAEI